jgi:hypothetical protein
MRLWALAAALALVAGAAQADVQYDARPIGWQNCSLGGGTGGASKVATGGTAVSLNPAAPLRGIFVQNPSTATESLFVDPAGTSSATAGVSIELTAGNSYSEGPGTIHSGALSINAATTGHAFVCKYGQ